MALRGGTPIYFSTTGGDKPVCDSHDVMATFGLEQVATDFMRLASKERRQWLCSSRETQPTNERRYLYKYQALDPDSEASLHKARSVLVHNRIWAAAPSTLNDPNDLRFAPVMNGDPVARKKWSQQNLDALAHLPPAKRLQRKREIERMALTPKIAKDIQHVVNDNMGVFSATPLPREPLMWSHYADAHKGICVQLASYEDPLFLVAKPVVYQDQFPTVMLPSNPTNEEEHYLVKSKHWRYEHEWRVMLPLNDCAVQLRPAAVSGVILGAMAKAKTIQAVLNLLEQRRQLGHSPVNIYRAELAAASHQIKITHFK